MIVSAVVYLEKSLGREAWLKRKTNGYFRQVRIYLERVGSKELKGYTLDSLWDNLEWIKSILDPKYSNHLSIPSPNVPGYVCGAAGLMIEYEGLFIKEEYKERGYTRIKYVCIKNA